MAKWPSAGNVYPVTPKAYPGTPKAYPVASAASFPAGGFNFAAAGAAFWIKASNSASYAASGGTLTSISSLVSGTPLATITGSPKILTDPRDNRPAFYGSGADAVIGLDALMAAAATGTNRAFTSISVFQVAACTGTGYLFTCNLSSGTHGFYLGQVTPGIRVAQAGPGGFISATSENAIAGKLIVTNRSPDGLTVYTSVNGGAETSVTVASHGLMSPDRTGIFTTCGLTPGTRFTGHLKELAFFGSDLGASATAAMATAMLAQYPTPPQIHAVGDSITTAQLATNGGMVALLVAAARADGLNVDPQGPIAQANGAGGEVYTPYRYSAASGNTCADMYTRITSNTLGLGKGGASAGFYRNTRLVLLMAGTNGMVQADYTTLLDEIYTRCVQHGTGFRIAVTPILNILGSEAACAAFNLFLTGTCWPAFEAAHPGVLIYWDANSALPNAGGADWVDTTHPASPGYVKLVSDPTYGLYQAVKPYLQSIQ